MDEWSSADPTSAEPQEGQPVKRVMTPAIENMSVKEERACLSEIRRLGCEVDHEYILSNGWTTGKFALLYVTGQHDKRKTKNNSGKEVA